jgi:hypothetical protein
MEVTVMSQTEQWIAEIVLDKLPKSVLGAMRVLARLNYPISDRRSFIAQLEDLSKDPQKSLPSEEAEALSLVRRGISPLDFPIETPVSGLEKGFERLSKLFRGDVGPDVIIPDVDDERPELNVRAVYDEMFSPACAQLAYDFYRQVLRSERYAPFAAERAIAVGLQEGKRCMRYGP